MNEQKLSKHKRRQLKIQQRKEDEEQMLKSQEKKQFIKKFAIYGIAGIVIVVIASIIFTSFSDAQAIEYDTSSLSFPLGNIHWHATPVVNICGENKAIPKPSAGRHLGSSLLHTHEDRLIHLEGTVSSPSQITIGAFMTNIGVRFSQNELADKKNGDACPNGEIGQVKLLVNGTENDQYENYVIRENDKIEMRFE